MRQRSGEEALVLVGVGTDRVYNRGPLCEYESVCDAQKYVISL